MAITYRTALNRVLALIGEEQIDSGSSQLTETYYQLLGAMMNDIKEQIEDAHNWRALRTTTNVTISAGAVSATISGATERSRVLRMVQSEKQFGGVTPLVFDITDANDPDPLQELDLSELIYRDTVDPDTRVTYPTYFAVDNSAGDQLDLYVWPRPTADRTIKVVLVTPQAYLEDTDLATEITIPHRPLIAGTIWYALEERGEELGINGIYNEQRYLDALNSAIARDSAEQGDSFELVIG